MPSPTTDSLYLNKLKFDPSLKSGLMYQLIKRSRVLLLMILSLFVAGVFSFVNLPRELNPEVEIPIVMVATSLPGASPTEVERSVTQPVEQSLNDLSDIDILSSFSGNSFSQVMIQFGSRIDPDDAADQVKDRVDRIRSDLPDDASDPRVSKLDFSDAPVLILALTGEVNRVSLAETAEQLKDELQARPEISRVSISGSVSETVTVRLDPVKLRNLGLDASQVTQALQSNNLSFPAGEININGATYTINLDNQFQQLSDVQNLYLNLGGSSIQLAQIADVYYDYDDNNRRVYAINGGERANAVQLSVFKTSSATAIDAANVALDLVESNLAANDLVDYLTVINLAQSIEDQFVSLTNSFATTILLVFLILLGFLGLRQAAIASIAIPLTFLSAFVIMQLAGISLNFLSLFSLLLALGLVVDNAIVVVEAANQYQKKFRPDEAGLLVFRDFFVPVWTATLTTVWAFLPLLLATGIIGAFIFSIPVVVTATLLSSTTIAVFINTPLTVIFARTRWPQRVQVALMLLITLILAGLVWTLTAGSPIAPVALAASLVTMIIGWRARAQLSKLVSKRLSSRFANLGNLGNQGFVSIKPMTRYYQSWVERLLESTGLRKKVYGFCVGFLVISFVFLGTGLLRNEFFPQTDSDNLYINIEAPLGTGIEFTETVVREVEAVVSQVDEVSTVLTVVGSGADLEFSSSQSGTNLGNLSLTLVDESQRRRTSMAIAQELRDELSMINSAQISVIEQSGGPPAGADLQVNIKGTEMDVLEQISNDFKQVITDLPGAINVQTSLQQTAGEIVIKLDSAAVARRGLSAIQIGSSIRTAITGSSETQIKLDDDSTDIRVLMSGADTSLSQLSQMSLSTPTGPVLLGEVASLELTTSPLTIEREDENRVVRVTAAASGETNAPQLLADFESAVADYQLPAGYFWDLGGVNQENQDSVNSILQAMLLSGLLILATLVIQLESFRQSALVMTVIPLAVAGVFFNFTLFMIPLSFPALIGVLALFGIVVNNSIILMDKINQNKKFGLKVKDAVVDAATSRLQPILLTSLTTSAGLLPITLSDPLWRGLGGAIIAGLSVSGILILLLLPSLYWEVYGEEK